CFLLRVYWVKKNPPPLAKFPSGSRVGKKLPIGNKNWEWMVTPLAWRAAIPVGATITCALWVRLARFLRKVVFPVPALPVKKIGLLVLLTKCAASFSLSVVCVSIRLNLTLIFSF